MAFSYSPGSGVDRTARAAAAQAATQASQANTAAAAAQQAAAAAPTSTDITNAIKATVPGLIPAATSMRLFAQTTVQAGDTLTATTTTEQTYATQHLVPANSLQTGQSVLVKGSGVYATNTVTPPSQRARIRLGGQLLVDTGPIAVPVNLTAARFMFDVCLTIRATGQTGTVEAFGLLHFATSLGATIPVLCGPSGTVGEAGNPVPVDMTQPMPLTLSVTYGYVPATTALQAANVSTLRQLHVHTLKPPTS